MSDSLETISKAMNINDFKILKHYFPIKTQFDLIRKKGVYPYEKVQDFSYYDRTSLPPIQDFNSTMKRCGITNKKYAHAKKVWNTFNCQNFGDYTDLYCLSDVLILADCFEKFRSISLQKPYELDPCYYISTPGLSWDCGLKYTKIELELLTDYDMILFLEKARRGGLSGVMGTRHVKANNKYLRNYDKNKESSFLAYFDANNLYGISMSQAIAYGGFQWWSQWQISNYNNNIQEATNEIMNIPDDYDYGYYFQVDLNYPDNIKEHTKNFPIIPNKRKIADYELSDQQGFEIRDKIRIPQEKLICDQYDKIEYVCHYRNLKFYLSKGMIITKFHRVLQFKQSKWLEPYIDFNTEQRNKATSDCDKNFYKLMNNSFYGKTIEDVRKRQEIHLINNNEHRVIKYQSKPNFENTVSFTDTLKAVKMRRKTITFNKPIYIGVGVLEHSKLHMYEFYYDVLNPKYGDKVELIGMDTDSFFLLIKTNDLWNDIKNDPVLASYFDFSNAPKDHPMYNPNNKYLGKFKYEMIVEKKVDARDPNTGKRQKVKYWSDIDEIVFIKPKCYSIKSEHLGKMTIKSVSKVAKKNDVTHQDFIYCVYGNHQNYINYKTGYQCFEQTDLDINFNQERYNNYCNGYTYYKTNDLNKYTIQHRLATDKLNMYVYESNKLTLSNFDDKLWIDQTDGITTRPHGYFCRSY